MLANEGVYCARDLRKYLIASALVASVVLAGTWWYMKYYAKIGPYAAEQGPAPPSGGAVAVPVVMVPGGTVATPWMQPVAAFVPGDAAVSPSPFIAVAKALKHSVVNVSAIRQPALVAPAAHPALMPPAPPPLAQEPLTGEMRFARPNQGMAVESVGSGVIVTRDGYILTNYHVVEQTQEVYVTVFGARGTSNRYAAEVVQRDESRDLALLKVAADFPLHAAVVGDERRIQVGDPVIAIGSPFGLDQTVSQGIISGKNRMMTIEGVTHKGLLQTDAAINQGNSGGPLVDVNGYVVGINTAIYTPTGAFAGVSFAVPSSSARAFLRQSIPMADEVVDGVPAGGQMGVNVAATNRVPPPIYANAVSPHENRGPCQQCHQIWPAPGVGPSNQPVAAMGGYGGVTAINVAQPTPDPAMAIDGMGTDLRALTPELLQQVTYPYRDGVFVQSVQPNSMAATGGLVAGDVVFKLDGRWVKSPEDFRAQMAAVDPGEEGRNVRVSLMRNGRPQEIKLKVMPAGQGGGRGGRGGQVKGEGAPPANAQATVKGAAKPAKPAKVKTEFEWLGMELSPLNPVPGPNNAPPKRGAQVKEVGARTPADTAGIQTGDLILAINRQPVPTAGDLDRAIQGADIKQGIMIELERDQRRMFATLQ